MLNDVVRIHDEGRAKGHAFRGVAHAQLVDELAVACRLDAEEVLDDLGFDSRLSRERPDGGR